MRSSFKITIGALLAMAFVYFILEPEELCAFFIPVAVHELGHILMLWLLGLNIKCFKAELRGLCIEYCGYTGAVGHAFVAAAGPAAGFVYAYTASSYGLRLDNRIFFLSAGISFLLSVFNLLPIMPLDGGRIFYRLSGALFGDGRGESLTACISLALSLALFGFGIWLLLSKKGAAMLVVSIWLLYFQETQWGIVKTREVL